MRTIQFIETPSAYRITPQGRGVQSAHGRWAVGAWPTRACTLVYQDTWAFSQVCVHVRRPHTSAPLLGWRAVARVFRCQARSTLDPRLSLAELAMSRSAHADKWCQVGWPRYSDDSRYGIGKSWFIGANITRADTPTRTGGVMDDATPKPGMYS